MSYKKEDVLETFDFYKTKKDKQEILEVPDLFDIEDKIKESSRVQVLLLSLDALTISSLSALLKPLYDIHCVKNIGAALALVKTQKIAVVIAEQALPDLGMSGFDFLNNVSKIAPHTEKILLAGHLDFAQVKFDLKKGDLFKLIKKPFDNSRIITHVNNAILLYLENSGSLAKAAENLQILSGEGDPVELVKMIPASANPVIIKCKDKYFFEEVKSNYTDKAEFIHAENQSQTIKTLKLNAVKSMIYCFESGNDEESMQDAIFLSYLKREVPYLTIVAIMDKEKTYYQDLIGLLTNNVVLNYFPYNTKVDKICNELSLALDTSTRLFDHTIFLTWPPLEIIEDEPDEEPIAESIKEITTKVKEGMLTGIQSVIGFLKKRK